MEIRYYLESDTGLPHIANHGVTEAEEDWVLRAPSEVRPGTDNSKHALRKTEFGRYLRVIYVVDEDGDGFFVITAYPLEGRQLQAFRRRRRKKR